MLCVDPNVKIVIGENSQIQDIRNLEEKIKINVWEGSSVSFIP